MKRRPGEVELFHGPVLNKALRCIGLMVPWRRVQGCLGRIPGFQRPVRKSWSPKVFEGRRRCPYKGSAGSDYPQLMAGLRAIHWG